MSANPIARPRSRRGFLSGLTSLPLVGGGVALIGNPTAAAEAITPKLLDAYDTWLFYERRFLRYERWGSADREDGWDRDWVLVHRSAVKDGYQGGGDLVRVDNPAGGFHSSDIDQPSARAAVALSAAGCNWKGGRR